jgi:hypothetical protein
MLISLRAAALRIRSASATEQRRRVAVPAAGGKLRWRRHFSSLRCVTPTLTGCKHGRYFSCNFLILFPTLFLKYPEGTHFSEARPLANDVPICPNHRKSMIPVRTNSHEIHHKCATVGCTIRWNPACALFYLDVSGNWPLEQPAGETRPKTHQILGLPIPLLD